jgi:hypothetical protein
MTDWNLGNLVPKELLNKVYDDAVSPSAKQIGRLGEDVIKTARLLLSPLQVTAAVGDRLEAMMSFSCRATKHGFFSGSNRKNFPLSTTSTWMHLAKHSRTELWRKHRSQKQSFTLSTSLTFTMSTFHPLA